MHSAPAGPPLFSRVAGFVARVRFRAARPLAVLGMVVRVSRRLRVLPVALAALVLGSFALAAPLAPTTDDDGSDSVAALGSTAGDGEALLPATGDGWTQDGAPAAASPKDETPAASESSSSPSADSPTAAPATEDAAPVSSSDSSPAPSPADTPASSSPAEAPSSDTAAPSASEEPTTPAAPSSTEPQVTTTTLDPTDEALSAVNSARTSAGCDALAPDAGLAGQAAEHSARMRDDEEVDAPSSGDQTWAVATGSDPSAVADDWLDDDSLLDCGLTTAGIGTVDGFWTLVAA